MVDNIKYVYRLEKVKCSDGEEHDLVYIEHNCIPDTITEVIVYNCRKCNNKFFIEAPE